MRGGDGVSACLVVTLRHSNGPHTPTGPRSSAGGGEVPSWRGRDPTADQTDGPRALDLGRAPATPSCARRSTEAPPQAPTKRGGGRWKSPVLTASLSPSAIRPTSAAVQGPIPGIDIKLRSASSGARSHRRSRARAREHAPRMMSARRRSTPKRCHS